MEGWLVEGTLATEWKQDMWRVGWLKRKEVQNGNRSWKLASEKNGKGGSKRIARAGYKRIYLVDAREGQRMETMLAERETNQ